MQAAGGGGPGGQRARQAGGDSRFSEPPEPTDAHLLQLCRSFPADLTPQHRAQPRAAHCTGHPHAGGTAAADGRGGPAAPQEAQGGGRCLQATRQVGNWGKLRALGCLDGGPQCAGRHSRAGTGRVGSPGFCRWLPVAAGHVGCRVAADAGGQAQQVGRPGCGASCQAPVRACCGGAWGRVLLRPWVWRRRGACQPSEQPPSPRGTALPWVILLTLGDPDDDDSWMPPQAGRQPAGAAHAAVLSPAGGGGAPAAQGGDRWGGGPQPPGRGLGRWLGLAAFHGPQHCDLPFLDRPPATPPSACSQGDL